jgi:hypothetical protein
MEWSSHRPYLMENKNSRDTTFYEMVLYSIVALFLGGLALSGHGIPEPFGGIGWATLGISVAAAGIRLLQWMLYR